MVFGERPEGFVSSLPEGAVEKRRPEVIATLRPRGTEYTVRVEENERFEVSVEEGSVDVLDVRGNLLDTVRVGESETYDFQQFAGQGDANQPPTASFDVMPEAPEGGDDIVVVSTSSDPDGDVLTVSWYLNGERLSEMANQSNWEWADAEAGSYTLLLSVEDGRGGIDEYSAIVEVRASEQGAVNRPPTASFAVMPHDPTPDDTIVGVSTSSDPDGDSLTYSWYFDGEYHANIGNLPEWTWPNPPEGEYTIGLVVLDGRGGSDEYAMTVTVVGDAGEDARSGSGGTSSLLYLLLIPAAVVVAILAGRRRRRT
jgi:hypothetical protein